MQVLKWKILLFYEKNKKTIIMLLCSILATTIVLSVIFAALIGVLFKENFYTYKLSHDQCLALLDLTPQEVCNYDYYDPYSIPYTYAKVDKNDNLILVLTKEERKVFLKQLCFSLYVGFYIKDGDLQSNNNITNLNKANEIDIDVKKLVRSYSTFFIDFYPEDLWSYLEESKNCGVDISNDFMTVTIDPGDNLFFYINEDEYYFYLVDVVKFCIIMQMMENKDSKDIEISFVFTNDSGEISDTLCWPKVSFDEIHEECLEYEEQ